MLLFTLFVLICIAACSEDGNGDSTGGDIDAEPDSPAEADKDIAEIDDLVDGDDEYEGDIDGEGDAEVLNETEAENDIVESIEAEPDQDPFAACAGNCNPDTDMQYCIDIEHLCYCDAKDNTLKYFPPEGTVVIDGEPCECVEKDGVSYCDFMIIGLCEMSFCNTTEGQVVACYDTRKYIDSAYSSGLCLDWNLYPPEESEDCDAVGESCGSEEGYVCMQWPGLPAKCVKTCESIPDTCETDYLIGCQPFRDRNRKLYPLGVCRQDWM